MLEKRKRTREFNSLLPGFANECMTLERMSSYTALTALRNILHNNKLICSEKIKNLCS